KDYLVVTSCVNGAFTPAQMVLTIDGGCNGSATETMVVIARDASGKWIGWSTQNIATAPGKLFGYVYAAPILTSWTAFKDSMTSIPATAQTQIQVHRYGLGGLAFPPFSTEATAGNTELVANDLEIPGFETGFNVLELAWSANGMYRSSIWRKRY